MVNISGLRAGWNLSFQNDHERERRRKSDDDGAPNGASRTPPRRKKRQPAEVGDALRTVYQTTINEDIPPEMLELLGKLG
jgi:hypothetical protein